MKIVPILKPGEVNMVIFDLHKTRKNGTWYGKTIGDEGKMSVVITVKKKLVTVSSGRDIVEATHNIKAGMPWENTTGKAAESVERLAEITGLKLSEKPKVKQFK